MAIEVFSRYEKKYLIDSKKYKYIVDRMSKYMRPDKFNLEKEFYNIANVYYDTDNDELIRRSLSKPVYKEKLRLRGYGILNADDLAFLEIKKKYKGKVYKRRTKLSLCEANELIHNGTIPKDKEYINQQILHEIEYFLKCYSLSEKVYISYDRKAFYAKDDFDFRVTFDTNIMTRRDNVALDKVSENKLLIGNDLWLMEVKSPFAIPLWFAEILSEVHVYPVSFSKYGTEYQKYIVEKNNLLNKGEEKLCLKQFLKPQQYQLKKQLFV